jgi:predicted deacetylase
MPAHASAPHARHLIVEVHDVTPARLAVVRSLVDRLDQIGARPLTLLVVPAGIAAGDAGSDELVALLLREQAAGSEIVLHGYTHRVAGGFRGRPLDVLRAALFAPGDAEFLSIDRAEARHRLEAGRRILAAAGLAVSGFCAPGWLEAPWLPAVLAELGFGYDAGMSVLRDLKRGTRLRLPWIGEVGAGPVQEALVGLGGRASRRVGARQPGLKLFMHTSPGGAAARDRVLNFLARELRVRRPTTYGSLLGLT